MSYSNLNFAKCGLSIVSPIAGNNAALVTVVSSGSLKAGLTYSVVSVQLGTAGANAVANGINTVRAFGNATPAAQGFNLTADGTGVTYLGGAADTGNYLCIVYECNTGATTASVSHNVVNN